jgi:hypothetical protein
VKAASCVLLCAAAIAAAGCGGGDDDSEAFRKDYNAVVRKYSSLPGEVGTAVRQAEDKSARELEKEFRDLGDRLAAEVSELRRLDAPDDAADEYKSFVDGLARVRDDLRAIAAGAAENSTRQVTDAAEALVEHSKQVSRDEDALKRAVE